MKPHPHSWDESLDSWCSVLNASMMSFDRRSRENRDLWLLYTTAGQQDGGRRWGPCTHTGWFVKQNNQLRYWHRGLWAVVPPVNTPTTSAVAAALPLVEFSRSDRRVSTTANQWSLSWCLASRRWLSPCGAAADQVRVRIWCIIRETLAHNQPELHRTASMLDKEK